MCDLNGSCRPPYEPVVSNISLSLPSLRLASSSSSCSSDNSVVVAKALGVFPVYFPEASTFFLSFCLQYFAMCPNL